MLTKLQKKTLVKVQLVGYILTLFIGVFIVLTTLQLYQDVKPLISEQTDVFNDKSAVISKEVSVFKSVNKDRIYFSSEEIDELKEQPFIKDVSIFNNADFRIKAYSKQSENIPLFQTDLFFESIPDAYIDVESEDWIWGENDEVVPIIIPENYLKLYNFGFAESQGLPVLSKNTISQITFNLKVIGNFNSEVYKSRIVGFSNKINSILVPQTFLEYANNKFGRSKKSRISRLLVTFNNPTDERILQFFNENNYSINKDKLEFSKLSFFFNSALVFVIAVALIILVLSVAFILLSFNLIIQKNKAMISNLGAIGYSYKSISKFYQVVISVATVLAIVPAIILGIYVRNVYLEKIDTLFQFSEEGSYITVFGVTILLTLCVVYVFIILRKIKAIVMPK
ncbi:MAG: ABC transporter permease [Winogradskyella sp.]|uniref:FtsX-like permease family protein n=1 Tax=Winogradskyella poriferorum TaxID=307627 RepID=A0ABU7W6Q4_9FLAO|nr:ABC transporter permease [Winogradskyella sp.]|tara:strand:+ start:722 stop:1909 length:1188 start_codon:yes stop_codon:yes gene_type:complete